MWAMPIALGPQVKIKSAPQSPTLPEFKKLLDDAFTLRIWILGGVLCGARVWTQWSVWVPSNSAYDDSVFRGSVNQVVTESSCASSGEVGRLILMLESRFL